SRHSITTRRISASPGRTAKQPKPRRRAMLDNHPEIDHGTPRRESVEVVTLEIDGASVTVPKGTSLMRAATDAGVMVPKLCATDSLEPFGSCRLCLVEID